MWISRKIPNFNITIVFSPMDAEEKKAYKEKNEYAIVLR